MKLDEHTVIVNFQKEPIKPDAGELASVISAGSDSLAVFLNVKFLKMLAGARCKKLIFYVPTFRFLRNRFWLEASAFLVRAKERVIADTEGNQYKLTPWRLIKSALIFILEVILFPFFILSIYGALLFLEFSKTRIPILEKGKKIAYFFLPFSFAWRLNVGGASAHMRGILRGFTDKGYLIHTFTSQPKYVFKDISTDTHTILPSLRFLNIPTAPIVLYNFGVFNYARKIIREYKPGFIYQRYLLFNFAGLLLSRWLRIPLVLEYNCSEVWMVKHWGPGYVFLMHIARWIERLNLRKADIIVVVSNNLKKELLDYGVDEKRILVNFNGVDAEKFSPDADVSAVRKKYDIAQDETIVGFIGTFSQWHGVEVLARAVADVREACPKARFLLIGDGPLMPKVREQIERDGCADAVVYTGFVSHGEIPNYLAACDILVSPHVQNPDGSRFFGSPTKLFEYMAMDRGIVASGIEQLSEILENEKSALLVPPNNPEMLAQAIVRLIKDPDLRKLLGANAREKVVQKYTWNHNIRRLLDFTDALSP